MFFDKNQSVFPSEFQREVWWWAVGIVPPADSLTGEVKKQCSPDVLEGCYQWHAYFQTLCDDMYENAEAYAPATARQYRDILEKISAEGVIAENCVNGGGVSGGGDGVVWGAAEWNAYRDRVNRGKPYITQGVALDACLRALARTGLACELNESCAIFSFPDYPKIFHAMQVFERSPGIRLTPARHHFAHCEFRQLFKSYNANYDELMRRASDESLYITRTIHDYCTSLKIQRYIHFGIIKYKHKGIRILDYNLYGNEYPTLRINVGPFRINPLKSDLDEILARIAKKKEEINAMG
jgi:hypothetical protein